MYSKVKLFDVRTLVGVIAAYYSTEDLMEARDLLYFLVDPNGHLQRLPKKCNLACGVVFHLNDNYDKLDWIFLALDLNRVPHIDGTDEESLMMPQEQYDVCNHLEQVLTEQSQVKAQLALIAEQLKCIREQKCIPETASTQTEVQLNKTVLGQTPNLIGQDSSRLLTDVVKQQVPRGFTAEPDGFMTKVRRNHQEYNRSRTQRRG